MAAVSGSAISSAFAPRRGRTSHYNPLNDSSVQGGANDTWICVSGAPVPYYARPEANSRIEKECEPHTKVRAVKEGNWLICLDGTENHLESGLYLPVKDPINQIRLFKNERVMLWDKDRELQRQRSGSPAETEREMSRNNSDGSGFAEDVRGLGIKTWHCVAEHGVPYRSAPSYDSAPGKRCEKGGEVVAVADNGWLKVYEHGQETGYFLPMTDPNSNALLFHSEMLNQKSSLSSSMSFGPRRSFRWVDSEGMSHRMSHSVSEEHHDLKNSDVWICVAPADVPFHLNTDCTQASGRFCHNGDKVNGVKVGSCIQVMEVTASMDMAEMIGRRSLKASTKFHIKETGQFLPFIDSKTGERLFKNEKLVLWEQASKQPNNYKDHNEGGNCSVM